VPTPLILLGEVHTLLFTLLADVIRQGAGQKCADPFAEVCGTGVTASTPTGGAFYDVLIKPRVIGLKFSRDF
jgi:hypothetical protein